MIPSLMTTAVLILLCQGFTLAESKKTMHFHILDEQNNGSSPEKVAKKENSSGNVPILPFCSSFHSFPSSDGEECFRTTHRMPFVRLPNKNAFSKMFAKFAKLQKEALDLCSSRGLRMVSTRQEFAEARMAIPEHHMPRQFYWVNATQSTNGSGFVFPDGSAITEHQWHQGERGGYRLDVLRHHPGYGCVAYMSSPFHRGGAIVEGRYDAAPCAQDRKEREKQAICYFKKRET